MRRPVGADADVVEGRGREIRWRRRRFSGKKKKEG
jgi:hypothetical protein